jgi:hypothetical protein
MKRNYPIVFPVLSLFLLLSFPHCKKDSDKTCKTCTATANGQIKETKQVCTDEEETTFRKAHLDASVSCQ